MTYEDWSAGIELKGEILLTTVQLSFVPAQHVCVTFVYNAVWLVDEEETQNKDKRWLKEKTAVGMKQR